MSVFIKTASFAAPILLIMFVSMVASEALIGAGIVNRLEKIGEPLASFANLPGICGVVLVTAFGSPTAANIMLQDLRENRIITEKETLLASILNTTSVSIRETLTYHLPYCTSNTWVIRRTSLYWYFLARNTNFATFCSH